MRFRHLPMLPEHRPPRRLGWRLCLRRLRARRRPFLDGLLQRRLDMKLPVQAPAVARARGAWPVRRWAGGGYAVASLEPAAGASVKCTDPTPTVCVCQNGIATCCGTGITCDADSTTGACN